MKLMSVNVGRARLISIDTRRIASAIGKRAVAGRVALSDKALPPGSLGKNLTIEGLVENQAWIDKLVRARVLKPRLPA
jgi:MOSC domain-containing protein YiiM